MSSDPVLLALIIGFAAAVMWAAWQDAWARRIPNAACGTIAALAPGMWLLSGLPGPWWAVALLVVGVFGVGSGLFAVGALGGGDVKLATAIALWAGTAHGLEYLLVTAVAGGVLAIVYIVRANVPLAVPGLQTDGFANGVPYGVAIAAGGLWIVHRLLTG